MSRPQYIDLTKHYPQRSLYKDYITLHKHLGGTAALNLGKEFINTCATRISVALNGAGHTIDSYYLKKIGFQYFSDKNKNPIIYRLDVLVKYLTYKWGKPEISKKNTIEDFGRNKGIMYFNIAFKDASGHITLFNGSGTNFGKFPDMVHDDYFGHKALNYVSLWILKD
ncbi:T6SS effector amidase Tae4 family protein [Taylorella asinigenitalis]|nr:T6SS effector amidase Tae4 family protein [Taylorella asinigenitalis]